MNRFGPVVSMLFCLMYIGIGLAQLAAIYSFFKYDLGWYGFLAGIASFILAYIPVVGSVCGVLGAVKAWDWPIWRAVLLFFWWTIFYAGALLIASAASFVSSLKKK